MISSKKFENWRELIKIVLEDYEESKAEDKEDFDLNDWIDKWLNTLNVLVNKKELDKDKKYIHFSTL